MLIYIIIKQKMDSEKEAIALKIVNYELLHKQDVSFRTARCTKFLKRLLETVQKNNLSEKNTMIYQMHILEVFFANGCYIADKDLAYWLVTEVSWRTIVYLGDSFTYDIEFMTYVLSINHKARYYLPKDMFGNHDQEFYKKHKKAIKYAISIGKIRPKEIKQR